MGGGGGKKRRAKKDLKRGSKNQKQTEVCSTGSRVAKHQVAFPLPFPATLPHPENAFLQNKAPFKQSFQRALETSYEGFVVDDSEVLQQKNQHKQVKQSLARMEEAGFFRTDVTQPFGLGTKCAKTYVTRCLVGEPGTTYKYLGLRMFAHPWSRSLDDDDTNDSSRRDQKFSINKALGVIRQLNSTLTERSKLHLTQLDKKRRGRGAQPTKGRAGFDITLINRMELSDGLKDEPMVGEGKCSVSWHADSSLEHYSTIAVYHHVTHHHKEARDGDSASRWSVGLRVAHNSEGPQASRRGTDIAVSTDTPPISVSLPSGSAYYLLDDFNHHHQHAVIAEGKVPGLRFSSTHRLLRDSHNVTHMIKRCKAATDGFHKKGPVLWRSEQLLLSELESEWIRQFYIQGKAHHNLLWDAWGNSISQLLKYWSMLENRTKQTIDLLQHGAEGRCLTAAESSSSSMPPPSRPERKLREKRKKAQKSIQEIMARGESKNGASKELYQPLAILLEERATMRDLWSKREKDGAFHELSIANRPMTVPFHFLQQKDSSTKVSDGGGGYSAMPGELRNLASLLRSWGKAFDSCDKKDLPVSPAVATAVDCHTKSLDWVGWKSNQFGLEIQEPWARHLVDGQKSIEIRPYNLPPALIGKKIIILQSQKGGLVGDVVNLSKGDSSPIEMVGWCKFKHVIEYHDQSSFEADQDKHLIKQGGGCGWKAGVLYGWVADDHGTYDETSKLSNNVITKATRRMLSLFEVESTSVHQNNTKRKDISHEPKRKRKKHRESKRHRNSSKRDNI